MVAKKPTGWATVTPRLIAADVDALAAFLKASFDAQGEVVAGRPSEFKIGDSLLMLSDGGGIREQTCAFLHLYVDDADQTYRRALSAGAVMIEEPADMPWGDRRATVSDEWGNIWQIATFAGAG